jgi:hypothetical protein
MDFKVGDIVVWNQNSKSYNAKPGDKAVVENLGEEIIYVKWLVDNEQDDGGYCYSSFKKFQSEPVVFDFEKGKEKIIESVSDFMDMMIVELTNDIKLVVDEEKTPEGIVDTLEVVIKDIKSVILDKENAIKHIKHAKTLQEVLIACNERTPIDDITVISNFIGRDVIDIDF